MVQEAKGVDLMGLLLETMRGQIEDHHAMHSRLLPSVLATQCSSGLQARLPAGSASHKDWARLRSQYIPCSERMLPLPAGSLPLH